MTQTKLNLSSYGNPFDRKTWSGTSLNILEELRRRERLGRAFDFRIAGISPRIHFGLELFSRRIHGSAGADQMPLLRILAGIRAGWMSSRSPTPAHTLHMGSLCAPIPKWSSRHSHYLYIDSTWDIFRRQATNISEYTDHQNRVLERTEFKAMTWADHIFVTGQHVSENLVSHYGIPASKITIAGTGLGTISPFHGPKDYTRKRILFTAKGRFRDKGGELVLASFQKAIEMDPELELTIVGSEDGLRLPNHDRIQTLGFVDMETLQSLFESHSLFLMPAFYEPWGLVYLEALACRMPIMGLDRNSLPELSANGQHGFLVTDPSPEAVAKQIVQAFQNPDELARMGREGQKYCLERFGWKNVLDRILNVVDARTCA